MSGIGEAAGGKNQMASALGAGTDTVSQFQTITFTKYRRVVLPADGFVFWVRNAILTPSARLNASLINAFVYNEAQTVLPDDASAEALLESFDVPGSLHYATELSQDEEKTFSTNRIVFTAQSEVTRLNDVDPETLYMATYQGVRFAFSSRESFYTQSGLWHYVGHAVYSDMESQVIDDPSQLSTKQLIVSNSLPIWLAMNLTSSSSWELIEKPVVTLYPSFLVDVNLPPPFVAVHVVPESTQPLAAMPTYDSTASQVQLAQDTVRLTLFGLNNDAAQDLIAWIQQYALDNDQLLGLSNSPILRDEKRPQVEMQAIAQKKTVEFVVNYYQSRAREQARQLLLKATTAIIVQDFVTNMEIL